MLLQDYLKKSSFVTGSSIAACAAALLVSCAGHDDNVVSNSDDRPTFEEFLADTYLEPWEGGVYIVNGDTPVLNEKHLREFYQRVFVDEQLIVNRVGGVDDKWNNTQKKNLTYCISNSFGSNKNRMIAAMETAAGEWEAAADVDFIYLSGQDSNCTASNNNVVFDVRQVRNQSYLARAFFPSSPRRSSNVLVDTSAFSSRWSLENILAHELGHTLGFRHEHTRPEAGACFENNSWRPLTPYDSASVMHYPQCNGTSNTLDLTDLDRQGAAALYGAPGGTPPTPPTGQPRNATFEDSVARLQERRYEPQQVLPGTRFEVDMTGSGDPDLYVRFDAEPTRTSYDCRPYRWGATESCSLDVPAGASEAHIMVRGYSSGTYKLEVSWVEPR
ncbi:MAG: M57 family metalloprotease [Proteobacteria bacterium]|nr:M57 family metalloprotease [Pseudomonadota bacterium]